LSLEEKEKQHEARNSVKRRRDDEGPDEPSKKLRSVVSTTTERSPSPERRPQVVARAQDEKRNRRLFGALVQGTLSKFREQKKAEESDERSINRLNVEKEIAQRIDAGREQTLQKERERIKLEKDECKAEHDGLTHILEQKCAELQTVRRVHYESLLSCFGKTKTTPVLYFLPAKLDEWSQTTFNIFPPAPPQPSAAESENPATSNHEIDNLVVTDKDTEIVDIIESDKNATQQQQQEQEQQQQEVTTTTTTKAEEREQSRESPESGSEGK